MSRRKRGARKNELYPWDCSINYAPAVMVEGLRPGFSARLECLINNWPSNNEERTAAMRKREEEIGPLTVIQTTSAPRINTNPYRRQTKEEVLLLKAKITEAKKKFQELQLRADNSKDGEVP